MRRTRPVTPATKPAPAPVARRGPAPAAWEAALALAHGDRARLYLDRDGSVWVLNRPGLKPPGSTS